KERSPPALEVASGNLMKFFIVRFSAVETYFTHHHEFIGVLCPALSIVREGQYVSMKY
ncbi:MAG: hypothetical protein ACI8VZ_001060, partial [Candidatus Paceibacteria bacterium]